jgi:GTPase SAR1 family protein
MPSLDEYRVKARGRLAYYSELVAGCLRTAEQAPHWLPGLSLQSECRSALELIEGMEERLDRKLLVTLIGPTGAGKSTLLNALAGGRPLSPTGIDRPTTRSLVAYCRSAADLDALAGRLDPAAIAVHTDAGAAGLENVILLDTPDMDSTESAAHRPLLDQAIGLSDVLVCVLNAENPKRKDTLDFLNGFVNLFPGSGLFVVLNRCDRIRKAELQQTVLPDLHAHLESAWNKKPEQVFCTSARSHLRDPAWPEGERPLHDFDEFDRLRESLFGELNQSRRFVDARVERARHLAEMIGKSARFSVAGIGPQLTKVRGQLLQLEQNAALQAVEVLRSGIAEAATGLQAVFYQKLAGRWWGPLGWLLALWARLLMTGAGLVAAMRPGRPAMQLWGAVSAVTRYRKTRGEVEQTLQGGDLAPVMLRYRLILQQGWPDLAQKLVSVGFKGSVRDTAPLMPEEKQLRQQLADLWRDCLETSVETSARRVSGFLLQLLANLPTLALMGMFAYQTVRTFVLGDSLPSSYFLHALMSIALVWLLSFILLQMLVRLVSGNRLLKRAFERMLHRLPENTGGVSGRALIAEIDAVLRLGEE